MTPKKVTTQLSAFLLTLALVLTLLPPAHASAAPFEDVPSSHWAYSEIMEAYADGAVNGVSANAYQPNGNVTMAQFIAILTRAFCSKQVEASTATGAWYAPNYEAADDYDLFFKVPDRSPETEVTREVMAQILFNLLPTGIIVPSEQEKEVPDIGSVDFSMRDAVGMCYDLGLLTGVDSSGSFSPKGRMTRAQTAVIYVRLKKVMETGAGLAAQPEVPVGTSGAVLTNGKPVTEENVLALMEEYKNGTRLPGEKASAAGFTSYVNGATYDAYNPKYYSSARGSNGIECAKFAYAFWDDIFGDLPMREITGHPEDVRPGDLLHFNGHWSIATQKAFIGWIGSLCTTTVAGGPSGEISWSTKGTDICIGGESLNRTQWKRA